LPHFQLKANNLPKAFRDSQERPQKDMKTTILSLLIMFSLSFQHGNSQGNTQKKTQLEFELDKLLSGQFKPDEPGLPKYLTLVWL
jgi:hypothetical protein